MISGTKHLETTSFCHNPNIFPMILHFYQNNGVTYYYTIYYQIFGKHFNVIDFLKYLIDRLKIIFIGLHILNIIHLY